MLFSSILGMVTLGSIWTTINWNLMIPVAMALMAAVTLGFGYFKMNGNKLDPSQTPGKTYNCIIHKEGINKVEISQKELQITVSQLKTDVAKLEVESKNTERSYADLKEDNREIVQRLDDLLKQMLTWLNES